jgi:hypothetical protein
MDNGGHVLPSVTLADAIVDRAQKMSIAQSAFRRREDIRQAKKPTINERTNRHFLDLPHDLSQKST